MNSFEKTTESRKSTFSIKHKKVQCPFSIRLKFDCFDMNTFLSIRRLPSFHVWKKRCLTHHYYSLTLPLIRMSIFFMCKPIWIIHIIHFCHFLELIFHEYCSSYLQRWRMKLEYDIQKIRNFKLNELNIHIFSSTFGFYFLCHTY